LEGGGMEHISVAINQSDKVGLFEDKQPCIRRYAPTKLQLSLVASVDIPNYKGLSGSEFKDRYLVIVDHFEKGSEVTIQLQLTDCVTTIISVLQIMPAI
jgi:hypothetical protein